MTRRLRDPQAERTTLQAAADRLLAGTPLRSTTGKLTASELVTESGLRRDIVYAAHRETVEEFQARVKAQNFTPTAAQQLTDELTRLRDQLTDAKTNLAHERAATAVLRRMVAEMSLELDQAKQELQATTTLTRLPTRGRHDPTRPR